MQKPANRMERLSNRGPDAPKVPEMEGKPEESEAKESLRDELRGVPCRWCRSRNTRVRKSYLDGKRKRFCDACMREFITVERSV